MASFVVSRTSRAARAARFGDDSHTPKANDPLRLDTLQVDIAALKEANLADAGPILLRLLQSVEFRNHAMVNGVAPSGVRDCAHTYMYNGPFIVDTPTRPTSPITPESATTTGGGLQGPSLLVREGPEGSSPFSTHSNLLLPGISASTPATDVLASLKGPAIVDSVAARVSGPRSLIRFSAATTGPSSRE